MKITAPTNTTQQAPPKTTYHTHYECYKVEKCSKINKMSFRKTKSRRGLGCENELRKRIFVVGSWLPKKLFRKALHTPLFPSTTTHLPQNSAKEPSFPPPMSATAVITENAEAATPSYDFLQGYLWYNITLIGCRKQLWGVRSNCLKILRPLG